MAIFFNVDKLTKDHYLKNKDLKENIPLPNFINIIYVMHFPFSFTQIFDTGSLECQHASFQVRNVQVFGGFVLHIGNGTGISVGDKVVCKVFFSFPLLLQIPLSFVIFITFWLFVVVCIYVWSFIAVSGWLWKTCPYCPKPYLHTHFKFCSSGMLKVSFNEALLILSLICVVIVEISNDECRKY